MSHGLFKPSPAFSHHSLLCKGRPKTSFSLLLSFFSSSKISSEVKFVKLQHLSVTKSIRHNFGKEKVCHGLARHLLNLSRVPAFHMSLSNLLHGGSGCRTASMCTCSPELWPLHPSCLFHVLGRQLSSGLTTGCTAKHVPPPHCWARFCQPADTVRKV